MKMKVRRNFFEKTLDFLSWRIFTYWISRLYPLEKNKQLPSPQELQHNYTGHWWFVDVKKATQHTLEITSSFNVFIDGKQTHALLVELTPKRLVILDKLGYHLIIQCENGVPATLYDEADDETYTLERAIYN